jgi:glycerophosphoryl diester phosphodiesterase
LEKVMPCLFDRPASRPLIIAHRGYRACSPENTLLAFDRSLGRCDMVELDVRLSQEGEVVIIHDDSLERTSDAQVVASRQGIGSLQLRDWPLTRLRDLDMGSWFVRTDPFGTLSSGLVDAGDLHAHMPQRILTLDELLRWSLKANLPLNIELKDLGNRRDNLRLAEAVIARIHRAQSGHLLLLSSFNHQLLVDCWSLAPKIAYAALQGGGHPPELLAYLQNLGVCAYHPEDAITDGTLVSMLRSAGVAVNVFTVNDPRRMRQLHDFGVTGIVTDYPGHPPWLLAGETAGIPFPASSPLRWNQGPMRSE